MKVTIIIDDDGEETKTVVDLDSYRGAAATLRLVSSILSCPMARAYCVAVSTGLSVIIAEYAAREAAARKEEIGRILTY